MEVEANLDEEHWQVTNNLRKTLEMPIVVQYLETLFDTGKSFEYITQQLKVGLCSIIRTMSNRMHRTSPYNNVDAPHDYDQVQFREFDHYYELTC